MSSRSCTLPKSPRFASKAPEKRLVPTAFPSCLPFACWNSKSASYGPRDNVWPCPSNENVHSPSLSLNANENERVRPGPIDEIPVVGSTFVPRLVVISACIPPTGIADSFVKSSVTSTISSSSSSISIRTVCKMTESEPAVAVCSPLIVSPAYRRPFITLSSSAYHLEETNLLQQLYDCYDRSMCDIQLFSNEPGGHLAVRTANLKLE